MERITEYSHPKLAYIYVFAKLFERASYYGFRAILVLFLTDEVMNVPRENALLIFSWFASGAIGLRVVGALLGDLVLGNKRAIIIGGIMQVLGAILLSIPSTISLYIGLSLFVFGGGLFVPNLTANFGKLYLEKTKLLDAGFSIINLAINVGSFVGIVVIGYVGEKFSWSLGFLIAAGFMIISVLFQIFSEAPKELNPNEQKKLPINQRVLKVFLAFIVVGIFWGFYEIARLGIHNIQMSLSEESILNIPKVLWNSTSAIFVLPIGILLMFLWSYFYSSQFVKLTIGFMFGTVAFAILIFVSESPSGDHITLYLISLIMLAFSESYILPIINSVATQYANPKYLAIIISLIFIPIRVFYILFTIIDESIISEDLNIMKFCMIGMAVISVGLLIYTFANGRDRSFEFLDSSDN